MTASPEILQAALKGLEAKLSRINAMIAAIKTGTGAAGAATPKAVVAKRTKRQLSPESRKRMAEAQRRRWAKQPTEG